MESAYPNIGPFHLITMLWLKTMDVGQVLRQIGTVVLLPGYIFIGMAVSDVASTFTGIWNYYYFAVFIPVIGLVCTWIVAPFYRIFNLLFVYFLGVLLAYFFSAPAYYPENHPLAYMTSYIPFIVTVIWGAVLVGGLIYYELQRNKP
jgi:hypothetical protein